PRREALHDWRGNERDPADGDRAEHSGGGVSDLAALTAGLLSGRFRALARAISLIERDDPDADRLLAEIYPSTGRARIVGITGSPGAGKSTLVASLAKFYRKQ